MTILDLPIRVDREAERISTHNGGATADFNGNEAQRREAMRFYEQAPRMARLILDAIRHNGLDLHHAEAVLRDAGVMSPADGRGGG